MLASHESLLTPSSNLNRSLGDLNASSNLRTGFEERLYYLEGSGAGGGRERKEGLLTARTVGLREARGIVASARETRAGHTCSRALYAGLSIHPLSPSRL